MACDLGFAYFGSGSGLIAPASGAAKKEKKEKTRGEKAAGKTETKKRAAGREAGKEAGKSKEITAGTSAMTKRATQREKEKRAATKEKRAATRCPLWRSGSASSKFGMGPAAGRSANAPTRKKSQPRRPSPRDLRCGTCTISGWLRTQARGFSCGRLIFSFFVVVGFVAVLSYLVRGLGVLSSPTARSCAFLGVSAVCFYCS